jgi:general L-amino acid transport system substrate-binding protein
MPKQVQTLDPRFRGDEWRSGWAANSSQAVVSAPSPVIPGSSPGRRRKCALALLALALLLPANLGAPVALAGSVLDRVKSQGTIRCGGKARPGLLELSADGRAMGMFLDLCRAIGAAMLGPQGRIEFSRYDAETSYDAIRDGKDDVYFLSGSEILTENLAPYVLPGPAVFYETTAVMVSDASAARKLADLAGQPICFQQGSNAHRHLEAWFAAHQISFQRMGYQEEEEMRDAYNAQACLGLAGEATALAQAGLDGGVKGLHSRILPEPLSAFPILANTGTKDAEWAAIVAWCIHTLVRAEAPSRSWAAGGLDSIRLEAPQLGLSMGWQKRVVDAAGTYGDIYGRNLGSGSPYHMPRGLNASWQDGGMMLVPYVE